MSLLVNTAVRPTRDGSDLFTAARHSTIRPDWTTPRAAFQALLAGDATLVDVRSPAERTGGAVPDQLGARAIDLDQLRQLVTQTTLIVLAGDDERAARIAHLLRARGVTARALTGGLPAWRAAGMPLAE